MTTQQTDDYPSDPPAKRRGFGCLWAAIAAAVLLMGTCAVGAKYAPAMATKFLAKEMGEVLTSETDIGQLLQAQATALRVTPVDNATVCSGLSASLLATMPCANYLTWLHDHAPYFAGAKLEVTTFHEKSTLGSGPSAGLHAEVTVHAVSPTGAGDLSFALAQTAGKWQVTGISRNDSVGAPAESGGR